VGRAGLSLRTIPTIRVPLLAWPPYSTASRRTDALITQVHITLVVQNQISSLESLAFRLEGVRPLAGQVWHHGFCLDLTAGI